MLDLTESKEKLERKNKILFSRTSACFEQLIFEIEKCNRCEIVLWGLLQAERIAKNLKKKYPCDERPMQAVIFCQEWARGNIKMAEAKSYILGVHTMAKQMTNAEDVALCHAVGQACSVVHTKTHAIGLPIYEFTALVRKYGIDNCEQVLEDRLKQYINDFSYCRKLLKENNYTWANFLIKNINDK